MSEVEVFRLDCSSCEGTGYVFEAQEPTGELHVILSPVTRFEAKVDAIESQVDELKVAGRGGLAHWLRAKEALRGIKGILRECSGSSVPCPTCEGAGFALRAVRTDQ